ncbi:Putative cleavage/polyadenylation specificity factor, A subunit [Septoria linicola]|uniref:Cleavage/polyadenylation specificity factor, A subunit n=1 Tax=Septoria linicola TaxID=215465 RepID=A0A9Q9EMR1_9PEZI|nr:putative cleavage/polyadenylation specificity factor, A subunit [Septoria linicola]USW54723.1 Putative cleavage/polyadenylation specificity factor, A subunit [Septoria linicola]
MQCYTELVPPTAVTHAVSLPFLHADANNLVLAKTSLLQVFSVEGGGNGAQGSRERLVLVGEYSLAGTVTSLARVKTLDTKSGGEAVLIAFKDAKLSLIEWDQENFRISTVSLHFYEGDNVVVPPFGPSLGECESILTIDPSSRCAALKFGARQLAILPFRQFGDELAAEEEGEFDTEPTLKRTESIAHVNGETEQTPYKASFTLALTALDPSVSHAVHLAFLHEYREPTFGILSATVEPSYSLIEERKDILTYTVLTLDLEQRASTNLISVPKLPSTLWKVMPLPLPIGGALLIGTNELVHVDQSGKANATAVNEFAKVESDFGMADQSHLNLKLEDCRIEVLDSRTGELLVITNDGSIAIVSFQMLGRSISAVNVRRAARENGNTTIYSSPSCIARLDGNQIFVGSEDGASSLLGWSRPTTSLSRKRSHAQMLEKDIDEEDDEDEDDDDLYEAAPEPKKRATSETAVSSNAPYTFSIKDELPGTGPINEACIGCSSENKERLELAAGTGRKRASRLTFMRRDIVPINHRSMQLGNAKSAWAVRARQRNAALPEFDNLLFVSEGDVTKVYDISDDEAESGYTERSAPEFESEGETIDMATVAEGTIVVQCRRTEMRTYSPTLGLDQIIPMTDEETDEDLNIVHVSFNDPYVLIIRGDSSVQVQSVHGRELEPLEGEGMITEKKWLSGSVYSGDLTQQESALFLLHAEGGLHVFSLPDLQPIYTAPNLPHLPPVLAADAAVRRVGTKDTLAELLLANLGQDDSTRPYLIVRTAMDDVVLYEPFIWPQGSNDSWHAHLRFRKVPLSYVPKYNEQVAELQQDGRPAPLKRVAVNGYHAVNIPGSPSLLLLKEPSSLPRILELRDTHPSKRSISISPLHRPGCESGFLTIIADDQLQESQLPEDAWYGTGWSIQRSDLAEDIRHIAYHERRGVYIIASCKYVDFYFAGEDGRHPDQDDLELRPQVPLYTIHLVSATSHKILNSVELPYLETVTALKVMMLEVSENTHEQKPLVAVSTAAQRGEDMPAKGAIIIYDIIDVVPEPGVPESGFKLYQLAREQSRGAITALAGPFPGGFLGTAQGLKLMVRGLKEDGSCLPVAFLDAQSHTNTLKVLPGRGMWLAGDVWKGVWFGGFTEEPYKLTVMGKSPRSKMEVMAVDFLPFDGALYVLVTDAEMDLHVLQYDPENPKSVNGMRLLHRSTFHVGHFVTNMLLVPSSLKPFETQDRDMANGTNDATDDEATRPPPSLFHVLTTSTSGSVGLVTPLDEAAYRRLSALQTHLTAILEHAAGLNPRAYRAIEAESFGGAKGVVDGTLIKRIGELGAARRADVLGRAGSDGWGIRSDLEIIGGGGLGYL